MLHKILLSSVAVVGLTGFASAADLFVKAPPPVYVPTWTGCYIGGHAGYGQASSSSQYNAPFAPAATEDEGFSSNFNQDFVNRGFDGGGQVGCQLQTGSFLWGLEGDWSSFSNSSSQNTINGQNFDGITFNQTVNQTVSYDSLWSVRGRFGGIFADVYHLYVTAGIGGAKANYAYSSSFRISEGPECFDCFGTAGNVGVNPTGIVFGAGAEWKIWPQFVIGAEYLHYALASNTSLPVTGGKIENIPLSSILGPSGGDHFHTDNVDVVRFRASYLFNFGR